MDAEPFRELVDTDTALAAIRAAARRPVRRRNPVFGSLAAAAAVLVIAFSSVGFVAKSAQPGDRLWGVTQVLYGDYARSVETAATVRTELNEARTALKQGDPETRQGITATSPEPAPGDQRVRGSQRSHREPPSARTDSEQVAGDRLSEDAWTCLASPHPEPPVHGIGSSTSSTSTEQPTSTDSTTTSRSEHRAAAKHDTAGAPPRIIVRVRTTATWLPGSEQWPVLGGDHNRRSRGRGWHHGERSWRGLHRGQGFLQPWQRYWHAGVMTPRTSIRRSPEITCIVVARVEAQRRAVDSPDRDGLLTAAEAALSRRTGSAAVLGEHRVGVSTAVFPGHVAVWVRVVGGLVRAHPADLEQLLQTGPQ